MVLPCRVGGDHDTEPGVQYHGGRAWTAGIERGGVGVGAAPEAGGPDDPGAAHGNVGRPAPDRLPHGAGRAIMWFRRRGRTPSPRHTSCLALRSGRLL